MTASLLDELLPGSAVRIDIDGRPNGTGFFVSPMHIVTCAHVLDPFLQTSAGARPKLTVVDARGVLHDIAGEPKVAPDVDLAFVQLAETNISAPVALLNESYDVDDQLYAFGYPDGKPQGDPATFEVEGTGGGAAPFIKFKEGQVRPGMSGAALLNRRTGAVCGIIKRTRDQRQDLGGYGIRVSTLFSTFEEVPRLNTAAHRADSRWLDALSTQQRRRVQPTSVESDQFDFVVTVSQEDEQWRVTALTYPPGGSEIDSVVVDLNTVRKQVPRLFRAWKAQGRINDVEQAELLGQVLYCSIAPEGIADALERLALAEKRLVHVSLCFDKDMDIDLVLLPWEQLYVESSIKVPLAAFKGLTLTRVAEPKPDDKPRAPAIDASVLVVTSPPRDSPRAVGPVARSVMKDIDALKGLEVLKDSGECSNERLEAIVRGVTVLHYIGVGRYEHPSDEIAMAGGELDETEFLNGDELAEALFQTPPRVVILQTLVGDNTPLTQVPADPTVFAPPLIRAGVDAVVAFPFPLTEQEAIAASKRLYEELAEGKPIRVAVQAARRRMRPWSRPALFMRRPADTRLIVAPG